MDHLLRISRCLNRSTEPLLAQRTLPAGRAWRRNYLPAIMPLCRERLRCSALSRCAPKNARWRGTPCWRQRSEEHTSELQSRGHLVCRLLLEKKKKKKKKIVTHKTQLVVTTKSREIAYLNHAIV